MMLMLIGVGNLWANEVTIIANSFTATEGSMDECISYQAFKGDGTSTPAINNGNIRLYQNNNTSNGRPGGYITISAKEGCKIQKVIFKSAQKTTAGYSLDGGDIIKKNISVSADTDVPIGTDESKLNCNSISIYNYGTTKNNRLDVSYLSVTYETSGASTTYSVTYDGNSNTGGTAPADETEYSSGDEVTVLGNTGNLEKTGYSFDGWNTEADGSGNDYDADDTFTITANTTLYAQWIQNPYTVTLDDDSSTLIEVSGGAGVTLPSRNDVAGYTFAGWSITNVPTATTTAPTIIPVGSYTPTGNITLYPVYSKTEGSGGTQNKSVNVTMSEYATAHSWGSSSSSGQKIVTIDENVTATCNDGTNSGKYYTDWRIYQTETGKVTISTTSGELTSVTFTFTNSNGGTLNYGNSAITSGTAVDISGTSVEFTVGNSGSATNGQIRITSISVGYTISGGGATYYWSAPVAATVERPEIVVAENPFLFSTTATITCATEGAAIKYSFDGENWNDYTSALTITENKTIYAKAIKDENESDVAQVTATKNLAEPTVTISGDLTLDLDGETNVNAGTLTAAVTYNNAAVEGATVTWSSSNPDVATIDASGTVTIKTTGEVTFTATYAGNSDYAEATGTKIVTVIDNNAPGSAGNPYSVANAIYEINNGGNVTNVYVSGIVSQVDSYNDKFKSITYWISGDGTTESQLECYSGKGLNGADFSSINDIQVGDIVTVAGTLKKYNDIYEFNYNNYLASFKRPVYEITAKSNNEDLGTVSLEGNIITATLKDGSRYADPAFTVDAEGEVTVEQDGNEFVVVAKSNCTVTINFEAIPTHKVTWSINGETSEETVAEGAALSHETPADIDGKTFVGWVIAPIEGELENAPTSLITNPVMGTADVTYYAVYAVAGASGEPVETKAQTLQYDTWAYSGTTTDKSSYRLFGNGSYIESAAFDLSKLSKVIVYGGTFGGASYNSLTIGDGTNIWKSVTVSGSSQTGNNTFTDGTSLTGTNKLRITATAGNGTSNGLRISKVEIFTNEPSMVYSDYCTTVIKPVATFNGQKYETLQAALDAAEAAEPAVEDIVIDLLDDAELTIAPRSDRLAIGTATTKSITINGNDHKLAFMTTDTDWNDVSTRNDDQTKLVLNDMTIDQGGKNTKKTWNSYDINFNCAVELNNVTSNRPIAFKNNATLKDVTISDTSGDYYGIWISPRVEGQNISIDGLTLTAGRGIKIDDEYVDAPVPTNLDIKNATFNTTKKAAILVKNAAATSITAGEDINIENVAADKTNLVWVDEDKATEYYNVTVTGANLTPEGTEAAYAAKIVSGDKPMGYYKAFAAAVEAAEADQVVTLLKDVETYELADGQTLSLDKNGHNITVTVPEGCILDESVNENITTYSSFAGIVINNVEELKAFRDAVNAGTSYAGKTVKLAADLDLSGEANWEPIGNVAAYPGKAFKGTFDGAGHTISHLTIDDQTVNWGRAALFGSASNATIKNLNITDVDIKSHHYASAIVAYKGDGTNVTIENCHVKNGSIVSTPELLSSGSYDNGDKVGAILGYGANPTTIDGCSAENINISGYRDLGSIAGFIGGTVTNCTAKDVTIAQNIKNGYKDGDMLATCGEIVGGRSTNAATVNAESSYDNVVITQTGHVAQVGEQKYETLQAALDAAEAVEPAVEDIVIDLLDDAELTIAPRSDRLAIGTATTKSITINGNDHKLAFMTTDTDWNDVSTRNDDQTKLVLNDMTIDQGGKNTKKTWNSYDINFNCAVELNNVTSNRPIAFKNNATLKDVTISDTSGDYYGIWISPRVEGQNISIDGLTLTAGRGIKIDDEYVDNPEKVTLDIANATFNTTKKAAILVKSKADTDITVGEKVNIENVAADKTNAVWVDEDNANLYGLVNVTGATMAPESSEADYAAKIVSGDKTQGYYKTFAAAVEAAESDQVVTLLKDVDTYALADGQTLKVDKNGHNINVTVPEGCVLDQSVDNNVTTYSAFAGIIISNVEELKAFRDAVNNGTSFAGKTVKLAADIDLSGEENWEPIGNVAAYPGKAFKGTFDGAGHTISHLTIDDQTVNWGRAALFGSASNATIKNLNITDVDIKSHHYASAIVAYKGDGTNVTIENCHVKNGSIVSTPELLSSGSYDNGDKVGAILGYGANPTTIDGCSAENINISGYRDLGSIAGFIGGTVTNCTAKDVTIVQDNTNGYKDGDMLATCGEIVGGRSTNAATVNAESSYDNVVITQTGLVAQIGTVKYRTLAAAVAAVPADGSETTITMIDNEMIDVVGSSVTIASGKNVVLDLNGHQVVGTAESGKASALITNNGTLTIKDSSEDGAGKLISGATPTWTWDGSDNYSGSYASNTINNYGKLTVESGLIQNISTGSACYAIDNYSAGNIIINGGKVDAAKASAIRMFYVNGGSITVNDGVVGHYNSDEDYSYMGIQVMSGTNVNVSVAGGTIAGSYALYANNTGGSLAISGGIFDGYVGIAAAVPNDILSISGGTFNEWVGTWGDQTKFISGGTYSMKPDVEYIADGYIAAQQGNVYVVIPESDMPSAPTIFHDEGTYEGTLDVAIAGQGTIMYKLGDSEAQVYSAPFEISETTKVTAWAEQDGIKSAEVSKTFTIVEAQKGPSVTDGYYNIKAGDKYVNVAGRKTVALVENAEGMPGTVIRVKATDGKVETLRSQGVDVPNYAQKAMNYVPEIVRLAVDKLHAEGAGELLGEHGLDAIMDKFDESFDYNLYLEGENNTYRIYGRTPSMKPVVDFYAENKDNVDAKLPQLEKFINQAIDKVLEKTGGRGAGILVDFDLETVWQKMGGTLTKPTDEASTAKFYEEVLTSEANVWNFAYQTAMIYWGNLKNNDTFKNNLDKLGDYAKYIDKVENIQPNFKYYIVPSTSGVDFISEGNIAITDNDPSVAWTMGECTEFKVNFDVVQNHTVYSTNGGVLAEYSERYTTLYTDFAYTLPDGVKAYKVKSISDKGVAVREVIEGTIPAQTPVLLVSSKEGAQTLTLTTEASTAVTGNLLVGADALINEYQIKTPQVETLFDLAKKVLGETAYNEYISKYEHLMLKNAGTVGNKYFFGLTTDDLGKCADDEGYIPVRSLGTKNGRTCFYENWQAGANKAFLVTEKFDPVKLFLVGDVDRDGKISIGDVTALVNIILGKATYPEDNDKYDFEAAEVDGDKKISISDVTALVNIILGK